MGGHGGHGGHSHYDHGLPKWIQALEEAPRAQVIGASIGVSLVLSGLFWSILMARGTCVVGRHVAGAGPLAHHFSCRPSRYFSCGIFISWRWRWLVLRSLSLSLRTYCAVGLAP